MKALSEAAEIRPDDLQVRQGRNRETATFECPLLTKSTANQGVWTLGRCFGRSRGRTPEKALRRQRRGRQQGYRIYDNPGGLACTDYPRCCFANFRKPDE